MRRSLLLLFGCLWLAIGLPAADQPKVRLSGAYGKLPLSFEANAGQADSQVKFLSRGTGYSLFLTRNAEFGMRNKEGSALRVRLLGANPAPSVAGLEELPGKSNYFVGNDPSQWRTNVPQYRKVKYEQVYPGVDLVYYGNQRQLEYDFIVAPGADPKAIRLDVKGAKKLAVDAEGALVLHIAGGEVRMRKPLVYQEVSGGRREVPGRFVLRGCIVNFRTSLDDIKALPGIVARLGQEVDRELRKSTNEASK